MDQQTTSMQQLQQPGGPVVLNNQFNVAPADAERFLDVRQGAWRGVPLPRVPSAQRSVPNSTVAAPHVFEKVVVPEFCVA
jgi:hypothetical protein